MIETEVQICNRLGLHARAAARFVHLANKFESHILVCREKLTVDGKSILGLLTLAAAKGTAILLKVNGPDEQAASAELAGLVNSRFGEES